MLSEDGKFLLMILLFIGGIFACGYFIGWSRDKLSIKIFDKMIDYHASKDHWRGRFHEMQTNYYDLIKDHKEFKEYALDQIGKEHVPERWGGELK